MAKFKICEKCQEKDRNTRTLYNSLYNNLLTMKDHILGKEYFNVILDEYSYNNRVCIDIMKEYERMKDSRNSWRIFGIAMAIGWIVFVILIGLCGGK